MKDFFISNISWLYKYFDKNKSLIEIFSFLIVAQSFIYSGDANEFGAQSLDAFKIVLWVMIFLVILLLQISTVVEIRSTGGQIVGAIFRGANFMKIIMRLLTFVLLLASTSIFVQEIQASLHNKLFSVFYGSLGFVVILEILAFATAYLIPRHHNSQNS